MPFVVGSSNFSEPSNEETPTFFCPRRVSPGAAETPRSFRQVGEERGYRGNKSERRQPGRREPDTATLRKNDLGWAFSPRNSEVSVRVLLKTLPACNDECQHTRRGPPAAGCCTLGDSGSQQRFDRPARFSETVRRHSAAPGRSEPQPQGLALQASRRGGRDAGSDPQAWPGTRPGPSPRQRPGRILRLRAEPPAGSSAPGSPDAPSALG